MTSESATRSEEALLEKQAVAWFTRMNGRPSAADRADFEAWLAASNEHVRHYRSIEATWTNLAGLGEALGEARPASLDEPLRRIQAARRERRKGRLGTSLALGLALVAVTGWIWLERPHLLEDWQADQVTARGEQRTVVLADRTTVQLDADSAIAVDYSATRRHVRLLRGTAFFEVTPSGTPFVVAAADGQARVLGTSFEVSAREDDSVAVTLANGSLEVGLPGTRQTQLLRPGESVSYDKTAIGPVEPVDVAEATAWREGRLVFNDMPLETVLQRIGRYRQGRLVLLSAELGRRRVSGNVTLRDSHAALAALQSSVGFSVTSLGRVTLISP